MTNPVDPAEGRTPDNLADPQGYQRHLVGLVGYDDPAAVQASAVPAWRALLAEAGPDLRTRPAPAEWSVLECLGHAVDAELVMSARYRWALAEDDPEIVGYDQDRWVVALDHGRADPEGLLRLFDALRTASLALWGRRGAGRAGTRRAPSGARPGIARAHVHDDGRPRSVPPRPGAPGARGRPRGLTLAIRVG